MLKTLLKEPLLHFLLIALLFFVAYQQINPEQNNELDIVISEGRQALLKNQFTERWEREPFAEEVKNYAKLYAINEIYLREARALGLDRGDAVIDRRLRQKMNFMLEDLAMAKQVSEQELQAFHQANAERYQTPPTYSFEQVFISTDRTEQELQQLLNQNQNLVVAGKTPQGDRTLLPSSVQQHNTRMIKRKFGDNFGAALNKLTVGEWQGPIDSGLGKHFVLISEKTPVGLQALDSIRATVLQDLQYENLQTFRTSLEEKLLDKYNIIIEQSSAKAAQP